LWRRAVTIYVRPARHGSPVIATIKWNAFSGENDWSVGGNWLGGMAPGPTDRALIQADSTFQVDIDSAVSVWKIQFDAFHATLLQEPGAAIAAHTLDLVSGTVELNAANSVSEVDIGNATVELGIAGALGNRTVHTGGTIAAMTDITLANPIVALDAGSFSAATGHTLILAGEITINGDAVSADPVPIAFGAPDAGFSGTVVVAGTAFGGTDLPYEVSVDFGTLTSRAGAHSLALTGMLDDASGVTVAGTLDLRHAAAGEITLDDLYASGTLLGRTNQTFDIVDPKFDGTLSGNFTVDVSGTGYFHGALNKTTLDMQAGTDDLNIVGAGGNVTVRTEAGANATVSVGGGAAVHFSNFADGGTTAILYGDNLHYSFVSYSGGLEVVVHPHHAGESAYSLFFGGIADQSQLDFGIDGRGHAEVTLAASESPAQSAHDAEVANLAAQASFVPPVHDGF